MSQFPPTSIWGAWTCAAAGRLSVRRAVATARIPNTGLAVFIETSTSPETDSSKCGLRKDSRLFFRPQYCPKQWAGMPDSIPFVIPIQHFSPVSRSPRLKFAFWNLDVCTSGFSCSKSSSASSRLPVAPELSAQADALDSLLIREIRVQYFPKSLSSFAFRGQRPFWAAIPG